MGQLIGRIAIVTGGASGIGRGAVELLVEEANVQRVDAPVTVCASFLSLFFVACQPTPTRTS